ncbi:kinase-like protein [Hyphopichia burtonii NRRL Y-1933]|uniref:non-specific serine/threonine protein kinase n=1 Tax=Hyphopichia burtonii NRRL Y-1933 TaxID=984485 RepID=A0A1E4RSN3_9ASCO|nr:kinase-like protein [Hyphopichia burtonii NRRL Y-1933]ODV70276.1 kinase-like protein [Hyphopichia burtonii NRRL Y-1933]
MASQILHPTVPTHPVIVSTPSSTPSSVPSNNISSASNNIPSTMPASSHSRSNSVHSTSSAVTNGSINASNPTITTSTSNNQNPNYNINAKRIHREVRFGSYILGSTLGEGEFGKVKLGWRKDGKQPSQVAIKLIKRDTIMKDSELEIKIHREINSLKLLNHPNIVNLVEVMKSGKYIGIVLEYASGGELFDYILHHKYLKENIAKKLFAQLVSGVDYMHSKGLIHRDLKLENLLLDKHKNVIISDFGFVNSYNKEKNDLMKTSCGSPCYAAPELVLTQSPYEGKKVDIWSLGVILYAMLSGYLPFDDDPENEDGSDIVKLYHYICKTPLTFPEYVSPLARDLLRKIIVPEPKKRINIDAIRNHPWLSPYVNLLSIRQPEWDKIHKESKDRNSTHLLSNNKNKRFSMINERTNSSSLMMNSHARSYSSTNIIYNSNTSVPTTSSSFANAIALPENESPRSQHVNSSASSISNSSPSGIVQNNNNANYIHNPNINNNSNSTITSSHVSNHSPTKQQIFNNSGYVRGHAKSASISNTYSPASTALKAVVTESNNNNSTNKRSSTSSIDLSMAANHLPTYLPRASTYTGTIGTIVESPTKPPTSNTSSTNGFINTSANSSKNGSSRESNRLPHTNKKPRPTSYHPSSMSSAYASAGTSNSNTNLSNKSNDDNTNFIKISSPANLPYSQFLSTSPTKNSPISENSGNLERSSNSPNSGVKSDVASRRNSVVTHIHVNGVLTSDTNLNNSENKRNSVLSYLEDKMDTLELSDLHSPQKSQKLNNSDLVDTSAIETKVTNASTPQISQPPTFAVPTTSPTVKVKEKELVDSKPIENKNKDVPNGKDNGKCNEVTDKKEEAPQFNSESEKDGKDSNKENKDSKKRNRFSILSFYNTYNSSTSNVSSNAPSSGTHTPNSSKRVLEPSSEGNVQASSNKDQKRVGSASSSTSRRSTSQNGSTGSSSVNGKEASAARKVMDFFKRRSIRIG